MSYSLDTLGTVQRRQSTLRQSFHLVVLGLMVCTSGIAIFDLYLFASSGLH